MILARGQFVTLNDVIWGAHLVRARDRRKSGGNRIALGMSACTNASCPVRHACGRFGAVSPVTTSWPGGVDCLGFRPQLHTAKEVA